MNGQDLFGDEKDEQNSEVEIYWCLEMYSGGRDVFRPAIAAHANSIILVHNHPSGDPTPSL